MNRLSVRLVVSHIAVAALGGLATFAIVRLLAPALFDESLRRNADHVPGQGGGAGQGAGLALRDQFALAVDQALLIGSALGAGAAALFGIAVSYRVIRPLRGVSEATRELARGNYAVRVPRPTEAELAQLADDVATLGESLAGTERRRVQLLGEVAHELRTPLTVVDGYVEGMIDGVLAPTADNLGAVSAEVRRMRRLSDDLSALSRAEEGGVRLTLARVELGETVAGVVARLRPQAVDAGLDLQVDVPSPGVVVEADADRLAQVVTNLVGNALRATPPGGVVSVSVREETGRAEVIVRDTGEGLAARDLDLVFERFYRVPGRRSVGTDRGSGIGLTIARQLARAHGGDLSAASPGPGQGATFTLTLPRAD